MPCKSSGLVVPHSLAQFSGGQRITLVRRAERGERIEIATRARVMIGEPYGLLEFNCEHLAFGASHDDAHSPQLQGFFAKVAAGALGLVVAAAVRR